MKDCCLACQGTAEGTRAILVRPGYSIYSPWFERRGDYLRATAELVKASGLSLDIRLFTKAADESGDGSEVDANRLIGLSSEGRKAQEWGPRSGIGLNELVRFFFAPGTATPMGWAIFRMLRPIWFDAVGVAVPDPPEGTGF